MSDIVERLRANMDKYPGFENMNTEAATEIERLRELVAFNEDQRRMLYDSACKLEAERDRWKSIALVRHLYLSTLEWCGECDSEDPDDRCCPVCLSFDSEPHRDGCALADAISKSARAANQEDDHE